MIFGTVDVQNGAVVTHRDSYLLAGLTVVSTRRPLLGSGLVVGLGFGGFGISFSDLLHLSELVGVSALSLAALVVATQLGQLRLLSTDLSRSRELSGVIWGHYPALRAVRMKIVSHLAHESGGS